MVCRPLTIPEGEVDIGQQLPVCPCHPVSVPDSKSELGQELWEKAGIVNPINNRSRYVLSFIGFNFGLYIFYKGLEIRIIPFIFIIRDKTKNLSLQKTKNTIITPEMLIKSIIDINVVTFCEIHAFEIIYQLQNRVEIVIFENTILHNGTIRKNIIDCHAFFPFADFYRKDLRLF